MPTAKEQLDQMANQKRIELMTINHYKPVDSDATEYNTVFQPGTPGAGGEYSEMNPDAISDGDTMGKGYLGTDLGTDQLGSVGNSVDIAERTQEIIKNTYKRENEYPNFQ